MESSSFPDTTIADEVDSSADFSDSATEPLKAQSLATRPPSGDEQVIALPLWDASGNYMQAADNHMPVLSYCWLRDY
ncbi:hypothetical protein NHJ13051_009648 [Beauveria bassiana]